MDNSHVQITLSEYKQLCQHLAAMSRILVDLGPQVAPPIHAEDEAVHDLAVGALKKVLDQHPGRSWIARELYAQVPGFRERQLGRAATALGMTKKVISRGTLLIPAIDPSQPI